MKDVYTYILLSSAFFFSLLAIHPIFCFVCLFQVSPLMSFTFLRSVTTTDDDRLVILLTIRDKNQRISPGKKKKKKVVVSEKKNNLALRFFWQKIKRKALFLSFVFFCWHCAFIARVRNQSHIKSPCYYCAGSCAIYIIIKRHSTQHKNLVLLLLNTYIPSLKKWPFFLLAVNIKIVALYFFF